MPIVDGDGRIIAVCCGHPNDSTWDATHQSAADAIDTSRSQLHCPPKHKMHRRGEFPAFAAGVSYGGGQKVSYLFLMTARH